jgi:hypothetical protein
VHSQSILRGGGGRSSEDIRKRKQCPEKENLLRKTRPAWEVISVSVQTGAGGNISDQDAAIFKRKRMGDMSERILGGDFWEVST